MRSCILAPTHAIVYKSHSRTASTAAQDPLQNHQAVQGSPLHRDHYPAIPKPFDMRMIGARIGNEPIDTQIQIKESLC